MATAPLNIVWLRRDLRLHDHAALSAALMQRGSIQPVFVFDTDILSRFTNPEDRRLSFIASQLSALHEELTRRGGGLLVLHGKASELLPKLCGALGAAHLFAARDVEPAARARDKTVQDGLRSTTEMVTLWDHLLLPPEMVLKDDSQPIRIFTPYYKRWLHAMDASHLAERWVDDMGRYAPFGESVGQAKQAGLRVLDASSPDAMLEAVGYRLLEEWQWHIDDAGMKLEQFAGKPLARYSTQRDMLAEAGTSQISPYLRFGLLSVRECARLVWGKKGYEKWVSELAWRDFYAMIMYHFPQVTEQEFQERFRGLHWPEHPEWFIRWQEGCTGYPVVDAAMRQLRKDGWMHNRARMITASFLTKDLLIDWRRGEEHFAQYLMDYDFASNNGGWQWAASTGTDAQPWFRIFNPTLQGKKFDPDGAYVRRYVPELANVPAASIHDPWKTGGAPGYPAPVVEHHEARLKALAMFRDAALPSP